jgi:hypothetical protein
MNHRIKITFILLLSGILFCACRSDKERAGETEMASQSQENQIEEQKYQKDGIEATYPRIITGGGEADLAAWNRLIEDDFNKILDIYSFNPFPEATPQPSGVMPTILTIKDDLKLNDSRFISILYTAAFRSPYSAHPTDLIYTTNIDKTGSKKLRLPDIVKLNSDFIKDFRTWDSVSYEEGNEEFNKAIKDYIANLSDKDLMMGFKAADQIGSNNLWGVYSYLTPDKLGISIGVPNYIGDHVEFEAEYTKLKDYLKLDIK